MKRSLALAVFFPAVLVGLVGAVDQCYSCTDKCYSPMAVETCFGLHSQCFSTVTPAGVVNKGCVLGVMVDDYCRIATEKDKGTKCSLCDFDLCNSAPIYSATLLSASFIFVLKFVL